MAERLSPAQRHLMEVSAAVAHAAEQEDLSQYSEYEVSIHGHLGDGRAQGKNITKIRY